MLLQRGNRKLPKSTAIFNLPAGETCPGANPACIKYCYAKKAERIYPQVLPYRKKNFEESKSEHFVANINDELDKYSAFNPRCKNHIEVVRIHESGDFYNQKYLDKWIQIANDNSSLIFYAYTKSHHLDFTKVPSNMIVLKSDSNKTDLNGNTFVQVEKEEFNDKKVFICPGDCKICNYCYNPEIEHKVVVFNKH